MIRLEAAIGLGAASTTGVCAALFAHLFGQTLGEQQFQAAWPMIVYIMAGLGSAIAVLVMAVRMFLGFVEKAEASMTKIAESSVRHAIQAHEAAQNVYVAELRSEVAHMRGEVEVVRQMLIKVVGDREAHP